VLQWHQPSVKSTSHTDETPAAKIADVDADKKIKNKLSYSRRLMATGLQTLRWVHPKAPQIGTVPSWYY